MKKPQCTRKKAPHENYLVILFLLVFFDDFETSSYIIFYFENVTFFHAKLGSDVYPRVDNQTSGYIVKSVL